MAQRISIGDHVRHQSGKLGEIVLLAGLSAVIRLLCELEPGVICSPVKQLVKVAPPNKRLSTNG